MILITHVCTPLGHDQNMTNKRLAELQKELKQLSIIPSPNPIQVAYAKGLAKEVDQILNEGERKKLYAQGMNHLEVIMYQVNSEYAIEEHKAKKADLNKIINQVKNKVDKLVINSKDLNRISLYRNAFILWSLESDLQAEELIKTEYYLKSLEGFKSNITDVVGGYEFEFQDNIRKKWVTLCIADFKIPEVVKYIYDYSVTLVECKENLSQIVDNEIDSLVELGEYLFTNDI